jgi:hypothetical protein
MATSANGIPGSYQGKIARVVMYELMGQMVVRSLPSSKPARATGAKKQSQDDFRHVQNVLKNTLPFIRRGWHDVAHGRIAFHEAMSANLFSYRNSGQKESLEWFQPSMGKRASAASISWSREQKGALVQWGDAPQGMISEPSDLVMIMAVNRSTLQSTFSQENRRREKSAHITLPPMEGDQQVDVFVSFINSNPLKKDPANVSKAVMASFMS